MMASTIHCHQVQQQLPHLLDDQRSQQEDRALSAHLANCLACANIVAAYRRDRERIIESLQTAPWLPVERRPWQDAPEPHARHGGWSRFLTGMNWLAGAGLIGAIVLALALVVPMMARGGGAPIDTDHNACRLRVRPPDNDAASRRPNADASSVLSAGSVHPGECGGGGDADAGARGENGGDRRPDRRLPG
jgi:anti-sigma factor RsiW